MPKYKVTLPEWSTVVEANDEEEAIDNANYEWNESQLDMPWKVKKLK